MKAREERQKVMMRARMRTGASWHDVCILNVSRRGVGIQAADPPPRGTYVEICRGNQTIVARVMWAKGHRAGLHSQDAIAIRALTSDAANDLEPPGYPAVERRRVARPPQQRHSESRLLGRAMEFACVALFAGALAVTLFGTVKEALARPLSKAEASL
jgi:hypothetical protein